MKDKIIFKVVVVEDEELILNNIAKKIHNVNLGFEVVGKAQDGKNGLELIDKLSPDLVITDMKMPIMNGLEMIKVINSRYPHIKKIVISGFDDFGFAQQAMKYDVKDYLLKPLKISELTDVLIQKRFVLENERKLLKQNVINTKKSKDHSPEQVAKMVELYIKENFNSDINFDLIAHNFNFNSSYLSKVFTKYMGENPLRYLTTLRVNKAKYLLINNKELSVKEIGEIVGYLDPFYFSRVFKGVTGKSPANYRSNTQQNDSSTYNI